MKKIIYLMMAAVLVFGCTKEEGATTGSIYGVITNKTTAEPMRATGVELHIKNPNTTYSLLTRSVTYDDGHYEFKELNPGDYRLIVVAEGYKDVAFPLAVEANRTARGDMQLEKVYTGMTVRTLEISDIAGNSAVLKGSYSANINYRPDECGFVYAAHTNPANGGTKVTASLNSFVLKITDLSKTTYYVRAYAKNSYGTEYGEERSFQVTGIPVVVTLPVSNVTANAATLNGSIEYKGDPPFTERGFVYSNTFQNPTVEDNSNDTKKVTVSGTSTEFSSNVSELTSETTYYVRAYATNSNGTVYGESVGFKPSATVDYIVLSGHNIAVQTTDISTGTDWSSAQSLCAASRVGGFSDWRLPTIGELSVLYTNRTEVGGFSTGRYWSSTANYGNHYFYNFSGGEQGYTSNSSNYRIRAVRTLP